MVATLNHKPYIKGSKRGEYKKLLGELKEGEFVDIPANDINRARGTLYMLYPNPNERITAKINKDTYRIWRSPIKD
tara:strand:- start:860 stop:1087 length:228 start_codon:yes stop_codon:yes gene_type:complete